MAKFISTTEISFRIESLISEAKEFIFLVTPFVKIHSQLKTLIAERIYTANIKVYIVCREDDLRSDELEWMQKNEVEIFFVENLHAKAYLNEKDAVVSSMNLYEYSMVNNIEFGFHVNNKVDEENYNTLLHRCDQLTRHIWKADMGLAYKNFAGKSLSQIIDDYNITIGNIDVVTLEAKDKTELSCLYIEIRKVGYFIPLDPSLEKLYEEDGIEQELLMKCKFCNTSKFDVKDLNLKTKEEKKFVQVNHLSVCKPLNKV